MLFHIQSFVIILKVFGLTASCWFLTYSIAIMPRLQIACISFLFYQRCMWRTFEGFFSANPNSNWKYLPRSQKPVENYPKARFFMMMNELFCWLSKHETRFWSYDWLFLSSLRSILHQTLWWWRKVVGLSVERMWPSWWTRMVRKRPQELLGNKKDRAAFIVQVLFQPEQPILLILINHVPSCNILNFLPGC